VRGVAYVDHANFVVESQFWLDSLGDGSTCARDIPYLKGLGVNTVFVDALLPDKDHSACMEKLRSAGIYVLAQFTTRTDNLLMDQHWQHDLQSKITKLIDNFHRFSNFMGFYVSASPLTLPLGKALLRDVRNYMQKKGYRPIPLGYAGIPRGTTSTAEYMNCGEQREGAADFLILDLPSICNESYSLAKDRFESFAATYRQLTIPLLIRSLVCNETRESEFEKVQIVFNTTSDVLSGSYVQAYFDDNAYNDTGSFGLE
jgi:hypothetical protein